MKINIKIIMSLFSFAVLSFVSYSQSVAKYRPAQDYVYCICTQENLNNLDSTNSELEIYFEQGATVKYCALIKDNKTKTGIYAFRRVATHVATHLFTYENGTIKIISNGNDDIELARGFLINKDYSKRKIRKCIKKITAILEFNADRRNYGVF